MYSPRPLLALLIPVQQVTHTTMSTRTFLITAGVLGGGYYLYSSRLDAAQHPQPIPPRRTVGEGPAQYAGRQIDESVGKVHDKAYDIQKDATRKIDSTLSAVEQQKANVASWAADKADSAKQALDDEARAAQQHAKQLDSSTPRVKGRLERFEDGVKEEWREVKEKKGSWFKSDDSAREEKLADKTRRGLEGWGETAAQSASEYYDSVVTSANKLVGNTTPETVYNDAKKALDDASKRVDETKSSWLSFNVDDEKKKLQAEAQRQYDEAQKKFDEASAKFEQWKSSASAKLNQKTYRQSEGFYDWLRGGVPHEEEAAARAARDAVRGWGNTAGEAAEEVYGDTRDTRREIQGKTADLKKQAKDTYERWNKWFTRKYDDTADGARDYYNDANDALEDAKKELSANSKHWWEVWKSTSKELEQEAQKHVDDAQRRVDDAQRGLAKWGDSVNKSFWSNADSAVGHVKSGLQTTNDKTQQGLSEARGWIRDQK